MAAVAKELRRVRSADLQIGLLTRLVITRPPHGSPQMPACAGLRPVVKAEQRASPSCALSAAYVGWCGWVSVISAEARWVGSTRISSPVTAAKLQA